MSEFGFAEPRGAGGLRAEMFPFHSRLGWSSIQLPGQTAGRAKCKAQGSSCKVGDHSLPQKAGRLLLELPPGRARALLVFIPLVLPFHALGPSHVWLFLPPCLSCALFVSHSAFAPSSPYSSDFLFFFPKVLAQALVGHHEHPWESLKNSPLCPAGLCRSAGLFSSSLPAGSQHQRGVVVS